MLNRAGATDVAAHETAAGAAPLGRESLDMSLVRRLAIAAGILALVTAAAALAFV